MRAAIDLAIDLAVKRHIREYQSQPDRTPQQDH
jgi:hypothetical protein